MADKQQIDAFVKFGEMADTWGRQYDAGDQFSVHSANRYRLRIVLGVLERLGVKRILDVGCGSGEPLIALLQRGYDAHGFDFAEAMVATAKENLRAAGFSEDRVFHADMESFGDAAQGWDAVVALGSVYYARDFQQTIGRLTDVIAPGGHFIFSLRNELFSLFSLNRYTLEFYRDRLMPDMSPSLRQEALDHLGRMFAEKPVAAQFQTVDDMRIKSLFHNPLTVQDDVLASTSLKAEGVYFYHFHALPPLFEHIAPEDFRRASAALEHPTDWRGLFMASAFVVHARKRS